MQVVEALEQDYFATEISDSELVCHVTAVEEELWLIEQWGDVTNYQLLQEVEKMEN